MSSSDILAAVLLLAVALYVWWERSDRQKEAAAQLVTGLVPRLDGMWSVLSDRGPRAAANVILALSGRGSPRKLRGAR